MTTVDTWRPRVASRVGVPGLRGRLDRVGADALWRVAAVGAALVASLGILAGKEALVFATRADPWCRLPGDPGKGQTCVGLI